MKKLSKLIAGFVAGLIVLVAKAEISSASTIVFYQPKAPEKK